MPKTGSGIELKQPLPNQIKATLTHLPPDISSEFPLKDLFMVLWKSYLRKKNRELTLFQIIKKFVPIRCGEGPGLEYYVKQY